ncbi:hypothetical protein RKD38_002271 [Streptomyces ambofaciens]
MSCCDSPSDAQNNPTSGRVSAVSRASSIADSSW